MGLTNRSGGTFISLDGIDGCGKSTQVGLLTDWLCEQGRSVVTCRDPGGTPLGDRIRELLLDGHPETMCRRCEMFLYMASRSQLVEEVIRPALTRGQIVVSDRYLLANVAYQGAGGALGLDVVEGVGRVAVDGVLPDLVIVLDLEPAHARTRLRGGRDRMEQHDDAFYGRVRQGFLDLARRNPGRIRVVDASQPVEQVAAMIQAEVRRVMDIDPRP